MSKENNCLNCVYKAFNHMLEIEYCTVINRVVSSCIGSQHITPCKEHKSVDALLKEQDSNDTPF